MSIEKILSDRGISPIKTVPADNGDGRWFPLETRAQLAAHGLPLEGGTIVMLCCPPASASGLGGDSIRDSDRQSSWQTAPAQRVYFYAQDVLDAGLPLRGPVVDKPAPYVFKRVEG